MKIVILFALLWLAVGAGTYFATRGIGKADMIKTVLAGPLTLIGWFIDR